VAGGGKHSRHKEETNQSPFVMGGVNKTTPPEEGERSDEATNEKHRSQEVNFSETEACKSSGGALTSAAKRNTEKRVSLGKRAAVDKRKKETTDQNPPWLPFGKGIGEMGCGWQGWKKQ